MTLVLLIGIYSLPAGHARASSISGPRTWNVLVGGQSEDRAIQAEAYYPHVITIHVGDRVIWTLNTNSVLSVVFGGTCADLSCIPECAIGPLFDFAPCGSSTFDGVSIASSGRMIPPGFNWDPAIPHGNPTYSLSFSKSGVFIYFDLSVPGMRGVVIVNPVGTPLPFTQEQYSRQAREELRSDLEAGTDALESFQPSETTSGPGGTQVHHVETGINAPEEAQAFLSSGSDSEVRGAAHLAESFLGPHPAISVNVRLSSMAPGSVHAVQLLSGVCGSIAPTVGFDALPTFTLNSVIAGADGRGSSTTLLPAPPDSGLTGGPTLFRIPSAGWFITVASGPSLGRDGSGEAACGNVVFHSASVMRFLPGSLEVNVGDTVVWTDSAINDVHSVAFLAGQPLPLIPTVFFQGPTGNATSYDGTGLFISSNIYPLDAGRALSFVLTLTRPGTFSYVDLIDALVGMQGSIIVQANSTDELAESHALV